MRSFFSPSTRRGTSVPHRNIGSTPVHLTFRLFGSLPKSTLTTLEAQRDVELASLHQQYAGLSEVGARSAYAQEKFLVQANYELAVDRALDRDSNGPFHLHHVPEVGRLVVDAWVRWHKQEKYHLYAICVMPNHIHVVLRQREGQEPIDISRLVQSQKTFTAKHANEILGLTGQPFWAKNYYDRDVRAGKLDRTISYVLNNPTVAGLVEDWRDWPFTWLNPELAGAF